MEEKTHNWIHNNQHLFGKALAVLMTVFGICLMVGAVKDWDWLYRADGHYQNNWSMGQISRYLGRKTARVIGFTGGLAFLIPGVFLIYGAFF